MRNFSRFKLGFGVLLIAGALGAPGCGDNKSANGIPPSPMVDAGNHAQGSGGTSNGPGMGTPVSFTVPVGGGEVTVPLPSGNEIAFDFPASVAGQAITLTPSDPAAIGWSTSELKDVVRMEPDGLQFPEPVIVKPANGDLVVLNFHSGAQKSTPEVLQLNAAQGGLELHHFSYVALLADQVCGGQSNRWHVTPNAPRCAGASSSFLEFACETSSFCVNIAATCCATPDRMYCDPAAPDAHLLVTPSGSNAFPYCAAYPDAGGMMAPIDSGTMVDTDSGTTPDLDSSLPNDRDSGSTVHLDAGNVDAGNLDSGNQDAGATPAGDSGVSDAGGPTSDAAPLVCSATGFPVNMAGAGTCANMFTYNFTMLGLGTEIVHTTPQGALDWTGSSTCEGNVARETVYQITPQVNWSSIQVSVDAATNDNVKISFLGSNTSCAGSEIQCVDNSSTNGCEVGVRTKAQDSTAVITFVISSTASGSQLTTRIRVD
ncbi:MAG TPA: hypothetical protein VL137_01820 [Polyangiaceae bacterium]|nr:hypothetical protein [Polyangiaceae bacterium]